MNRFVTILAVIVLAAAAVAVFNKRIETMGKSRALAEWQSVRSDTSIAALQSFLTKHRKSPFAAPAQHRLDSLRMEKAWQKASADGTRDALMQFISEFPSGPYASKADSLLSRSEAESDWLTAKKLNSPQAFENVISKHPGTPFAVKAESSLIALEVAGIFKRDHTLLPDAQRMTTVDSQISVVEIENSTPYTLTIRYSGKDSKRLTLKPKETVRTSFAVGRYKVTASANSSQVMPFASEQVLEGGEYVSHYFIR